MLIDDCGAYLEQVISKYAIFLINGAILRSTIEEKAILKVLPVARTLLDDIPIGHIFVKLPVIIFHASQNVAILILSQSENIVENMLEGFIDTFQKKLDAKYKSLPKTLADLFKFAIFSSARKLGPEPLGWWEKSPELSDESIFKYSLSSMMMLVNEVEGAKHRYVNFHPFISNKLIGIIFLFQIPLEKARGGAFDSAILIMANYDDRSILYQNHKPLEKICSLTADELTQLFYATFGDDIHRNITKSEKSKFAKLLKNLYERLNSVPIQQKSSEDVKKEMQDSMDLLKKLL
jgi:hypothetical protein